MEIADAIEEFLPVRGLQSRSTILATVLFTDIVGSTEKAAALGDSRWHNLLDKHHTTICSNLARFRGHEVKSTGDGILATFDGPARGVRCACAIAEEIRPLGIDVRAGPHTGECEAMGEDVGGIAVHIGAGRFARGCRRSISLKNSQRSRAGSGLPLCGPRKPRHSKGVPGDWQIYAVEK